MNKLILVDLDAMFGLSVGLGLPSCGLDLCDRKEGNYREPNGLCSRRKWCLHARRTPELTKAYRDPTHFRGRRVLQAVPLSFQKLHLCGWSISFWSTRPKSQNYEIIEVLKKEKLWDLAQQMCGTDTLLNTIDLPASWDYSVETAKLTVLERIYGSFLEPQATPIVAVEIDLLEAAILSDYAKDRLSIKLSPVVWIEILATDPESLEEVLLNGRSKVQSQ